MSVSKAVRLLRTKINRNGCRSNRTMAMQDWQLSMAKHLALQDVVSKYKDVYIDTRILAPRKYNEN